MKFLALIGSLLFGVALSQDVAVDTLGAPTTETLVCTKTANRGSGAAKGFPPQGWKKGGDSADSGEFQRPAGGRREGGWGEGKFQGGNRPEGGFQKPEGGFKGGFKGGKGGPQKCAGDASTEQVAPV